MKLKVGDDVYEFDTDTLLIAELKVIKKKTGLTLRDWGAALQNMDPDALQSFIYLAKKRANIVVDYDALEDIDIQSIEITDDEDDDEDAEGEPDPTGAQENPPGTSTSMSSEPNGSESSSSDGDTDPQT